MAGAATGATTGATLGGTVTGGNPIGVAIGAVIGAVTGFLGGGGSGSKQDIEYISDVNAEKQREYSAAQAALNKVNPNDSITINNIKNAFNAAMAEWGDPNNPTRNVANPAAFKSAMADIEANYKDPYAAVMVAAPAPTATTAPDILQAAALTSALTAATAPQIVQTQPLQTSSIDTYMPVILIGLGVVALIFILKKK